MRATRQQTVLTAAVLATVLASGCATRLQVRSEPDGAEVSIYADPSGNRHWEFKDRVRTPGTYTLKRSRDFFGGRSDAQVNLLFRKDGYAAVSRVLTIRKHETNPAPKAAYQFDPVVRLPLLDTAAEIVSVPTGARLSFYRTAEDARASANPVPVPIAEAMDVLDREDLPASDPTVADTVRLRRRDTARPTPWRLECPSSFAEDQLKSIRYVRAEREDCLTSVRPFSIAPGSSQSLDIRLVSTGVTLDLRSTPPGATVEDVRPGGFGRLGETDTRVQLSGPAVRSRIADEQGLLALDLRAFKEGYAEWNRSVQIRPGEPYAIAINLQPKQSAVWIDSDPPGAAVYVLRKVTSPDRKDAEQGRADALYRKHLGITPFSYNIDPADPLVHGEKLFFEKEGFRTTEAAFAKGASVLHGRLPPAGMDRR